MRKRKHGRILSVIMTICMILGMLPVSMLDGIVSVSAADVSTGVTFVTEGDVSSNDGKKSTWTFDGAGLSSSKTLKVEDTLAGNIKVLADKVQLKNNNQGLTLQSSTADTDTTAGTGGKIAISLDSSTEKVKITIEMANITKDDKRHIVVGNTSNKYYDVYHVSGHAEGKTNSAYFDEKTKKWEAELDSNYFTDGKLILEGRANASGKDNKIKEITIVEKAGTSSGGENLVDVHKTYKFTWDDSDSENIIKSTEDGKKDIFSEDGKVSIGVENTGNELWHHTSNGATSKYATGFKPNHKLYIEVNGDAKVVMAGSVWSAGTIDVVDGNGNTVVESLSTKTEADVAYPYNVEATDNTTISFKYTGEATTLTVTFSGGTTYCPWMTLYYKDVAPTTVEKTFPVSIKSGSDLLAGGNINVTDASNSGNTFIVNASVTTLNLMTKTEYNVSTDNDKIKATVGGKTSFKTGEDVAAIEFDVESLVVNPTVKLKEGSTLADGKKISIVDDKNESTGLTVGSSVELWIGKDYKIKCDDETVEARVGGNTSFKAAADMTSLEVELVSKANNVTMTVAGVSLGNAKVVMTNTADSADTHEFVSGDKIQLKLNATYEISCTDKEIFAKIDGKSTYKVANPISALTVDLTKAEYHTYDVWDFGAEQLESDTYNTYNNKLTKDIINGWYKAGTVAGSVHDKNNVLPPTTDPIRVGDIALTSKQAGKIKIRANSSTGLTMASNDNSLVDENGNNYLGILYDNAGKGYENSGVAVELNVKAGDLITALVSSNGGSSKITWESPSGKDKQEITYTRASRTKLQTMHFTCSEDGVYKLYSGNEKLVVARIYRERPSSVEVSGTVTAPDAVDLSKAELVFTQKKDDKVINTIKTSITNGSYKVSLQEEYTYELSLDGANGYIVDTVTTGKLKLANGDSKTGRTLPVTIVGVDLVTVEGSLAALTKEDAAKLKLTLKNQDLSKPYKAVFTVKEGTNNFTAVLEKGETYLLTAEDVDDYALDTTSISADKNGKQDIKFTKKQVYGITVKLLGPTAAEAKNVKLTFSILKDVEKGEVDSRYIYEFKGTSGIKLRDGQYKVTAELDGYKQAPTADLKVSGGATEITVTMKSTAPAAEVPYKETITVNQNGGADYASINEALEAVRNMKRDDSQRVTISIAPGDYEEMLVVDVPNVTLKNASATPSIALSNNGVNIDANAVRITSYYGHGYSYYSMGDDYKWNADVLAANKSNGYESVTNIGSGTKTYWNATVEIQADGFKADNIIFENSFNQYVSKKAAADVIVKQSGAKEGSTTRYALPVGSTAVQQKAYVERAAALAIGNGKSDITFNGCKFIGRQDTLYGGAKTYAEFNQCSVYGGTDYIFGGMTAIFDKCDLVFNTTDDKNDVGYITAAQQSSGRGYFMNECHVTSVKAGVDVDAAYYKHNTSKPGFFGRPWAVNTSEVVFYNTKIDAADPYWETCTDIKAPGKSLIAPAGWDSSLSGQSAGMYEYGTVEAADVDYSQSRVTWATSLTGDKLNDGTYIKKEAFRQNTSAGLYELNLSAGLKAGVDYDGGVSVMENMGYKTDGYVQGSSNAKFDATTGIPTSGAVLKIDAQDDGRVKIKMKSAGGKTVYWVGVNSNGKSTIKSWVSNTNETVVFPVEKGSTYYFYGSGTKVCLYSVSVDYRPYVDWDTVTNPTLGTPVAAAIGDENEGTITIPYSAAVGSVYSESMAVRVFLDGELVETVSVTDETDPLKNFESEFVYEPAQSGTYTFQVMLKRSGEASKVSDESSKVQFKLPMKKPVIVNTENAGSGNVKLSWQEVTEATSYDVYLDGKKVANTKDLFYRYEKLTVGTEYKFGVVALGNGDASEIAESTLKVTSEGKKNWQFSAFGSGVDTKNNGYKGSYESGNLKVFSKAGKGKLVPNSTDGLAFYYTTIDPETENFTLTADVTVDTWTYSNGQEGFGLMAADNVGVNGDATTFWNNSYMASVTKVEYYWDSVEQKVSDTGDKYSMYLGVGAQEKTGVTQDNLAGMINGSAVSEFNTKMHTLETYAPTNGKAAGSYNIVSNLTGATKGENLNTKTTFKLTIQRNNTGYFLSYTDEAGVTNTKKFYHGDNGDELTKLDPNNIYVGFFASRNAEISVSNMQLTTINPKDDAPAEERPISYVTPNVSFESSSMSNSEDYELVYYGNVDGKLYIAQGNKTLAGFIDIKANTKYRFNTKLVEGDNTFVCSVAPDLKYCPSKYEKLSSYDVIDFTKTVTYKNNTRNIVYVSPAGTSKGVGSKEDPKSIYEAVKWAAPGDVIMLMGGTYNMNGTLTIDRGIDGTAEKNITMMADPEASQRPVFNFGKKSSGMVLAGDYWYFKGFDVTNSAAGQKGIQVSGSNNTLDGIRTYKNGNTGIQISRYKGTDLYEDWPANNLILNCTSYLNADPGYEDADGFAAKLTIGDGNVFDGCISAYNADDGWDLFAKIETGPIGKVVIRNSIAFKNGYVISDITGEEVNAGNGNGFKMGGESITGYHTLQNSIAFGNKAKGIDSNSCPDIQVYNSTSFDNESYNVAFYTNNAKNTDYLANGVLSYKKSNTEGENIKPKGMQDESKIYNLSSYYFNGGKSTNGKEVVTDEWFVSLDMDKAIHGGITRNADGSINMNGFLELVDATKAGAKLSGNGSSSPSIEVPELVVDEETEKEEQELNTPVVPDYDDDDDDTDSTSSGSTSSDNSTNTEDYDVLKPEDIPGSTVTQIDGTNFAELGEISYVAEKIVKAVDNNGKVSSSVEVIKDTTSVANKIIDKINADNSSEVVVFASEGTSVSKKVFDKLKETGKTLSIGVVDGQGKVNAIISIDGNKIKGTSVDFNLKVTVDAKNSTINSVATKAGINNDKFTVVDFKYSGTLPGTLKAAVNVANKYADGTKLALYYYNASKGVLENQYQLTTVSDGYAEFAIDHCSQYVLVDVSAAEGTITTGTLGSPKTLDTNALMMWIIVMLATLLALIGYIVVYRKRRA